MSISIPNPGRRLIFDAFVPDPKKVTEGKATHQDFDGQWKDGCKLERHITSDPQKHQLNLLLELRWQEEPGGELSHDQWPCALHLYNLEEVQRLVEQSPLHLEKVCGDFEDGPFTSESKDFVVFCRKERGE